MKKPKTKTPSKPAPEPEPMVFEHVPVERPYDRIANRILAATHELNKALEEAHQCAEMRVFIMTAKSDGEAMRFEPQIYNLTHSTLTYRIEVQEEASEKMWRLVKDPRFKDAAGQAFNALRKKAPNPT